MPATSATSIFVGLKKVLFVGLAAVGAVYVASLVAPRALLLLSPSPPAVGVGNVLFSPDGKFKALVFSENGGGRISPYCFDFISVAPASVPNTAADQDSYRVYTASCHTLGFRQSLDGQRMMVNAPLIRWLSNVTLQVTFDPTMAASGIEEAVFRGWAVKGQVHIIYNQFVENGP